MTWVVSVLKVVIIAIAYPFALLFSALSHICYDSDFQELRPGFFWTVGAILLLHFFGASALHFGGGALRWTGREVEATQTYAASVAFIKGVSCPKKQEMYLPPDVKVKWDAANRRGKEKFDDANRKGTAEYNAALDVLLKPDADRAEADVHFRKADVEYGKADAAYDEANDIFNAAFFKKYKNCSPEMLRRWTAWELDRK